MSHVRGVRGRAGAFWVALGGAALLSIGGMAAAEQIPEFSLKDPAEGVHTQKELLERGAVIVVTIPNVKHGENQERWTNGIKKALPETGPRVVVLEDMSQSNVREKAMKSMKEKYQPGQRTLLLVDPTGETRRAFGVPQDETAVLVCNREGAVIHRVVGVTVPDEVKEALKRLVKAAQEIGAAPAKDGGGREAVKK
jgi:hypothetical protein